MDFAKCWSSCGNEWTAFDVWTCLVMALFLFDIALILYRRWRARQLDFPARFRLGARKH
jgi:hypothetical protein